MTEFKMSLYKNMKEKENSEITLEDYVNKIKYGCAQDAVINARAVKQRGDLDKYKQIKSQAHVVTARGTIPSGESKTAQNIKLTGLCEIDVDEVLSDEQLTYITNDPYVLCAHKSIGGDGYVIFFKVDVNKMDNAYYAIGEYLRAQYDITADPSGKNINRLRFLSWDEDIYYNPKAKKFIVKVEKKNQLPTNLKFLHDNKSLDYIIEQIQEKNIDLCQESYELYVKIGCALASEYAESGEAYFHKICSFGSKYNPKHATRDYKGFLRCTDKISIATIYWLAKNAGLELYTDKTKSLIQRVKISKSQGTPTIESIEQNMNALGFELDDNDRNTVQQLIDSKEDYSSLANEGVSEIKQLANFVKDTFNPTLDELTLFRFINGKRLSDAMVHDIYLTCKDAFTNFKVNKEDVKSIVYSNMYVEKFNILKDFLEENKEIETNNAIDRVIDCIELDENTNKEFVKWAFTKWLVGALHNWIRDEEEDEKVSSLVLVLCSSRMGAGKTQFFRNFMPKELKSYYVESSLSTQKDAKLRFAKSLLLVDDEYGGKSIKENEQFKALTSQGTIQERVSYGREDEIFIRRSALGGTSNEYNLLKDFTGKNRRVLPLNILGVKLDDYIKINKTELIMEAYNLLKGGFEWDIYKEEDVNYLYDNTQANLDQLPVDDIFKMHFSFEEDEEFNSKVVWNQGEIINYFARWTPHKLTRYDVKHIMDKNFQRISTHRVNEKTKRGYLFYRKDINSYEFPSDMQLDECPF